MSGRERDTKRVRGRGDERKCPGRRRREGSEGAREGRRECESRSDRQTETERAIIDCVQVTVQEIRLRCCSPTCIVLINLCLRQSPVSYLDPHVINLRAAVDNRLEQEDLPLAPWY